ncbi:hypothetical protein J3B02_001782 [Coemansia erecta]|nr:hypothetical protein J3B02_001782 [Coemansia erecta]
MSAHQIRQAERQKWLRSKRQKHGSDFLPGQDDGTHDSLAELLVIGYSAHIFRPKAENGISESETGLIDLGLSSSHSSIGPIIVDRYDIRHLLSETQLDLCLAATSNKTETLPDPELNVFRFSTLDTESDSAQAETLEQKTSASLDSQEQAAAKLTNKETAQSDIPEDPPFRPLFSVPEGMAVPATQRHFDIIEKTAQFIADQPSHKANQMELIIQGKQGTNPDFAFLGIRDALYPFYKHLRWLMQTNLYSYNNSESESDSESEPEPEPEPEKIALSPADTGEVSHAAGAASQPAQLAAPCAPEDMVVPQDSNDRLFIERVAHLVASSPTPGRLEQKLRVEKATVSASYAFLSPFDPLNCFFCFLRDCYIQQAEPEAIGRAVDSALERQLARLDSSGKSDMSNDAEAQLRRRQLAREFIRRKRLKQ